MTAPPTDAPVPLVDLRANHLQVADAVAEGWQRVVDRTAFVGGDEVRAFEEAFARYQGVRHCVGVANGTDALELALRAVGVGPGDRVALPANTFIATAMAVARAGATPALVDCDPDHHLIDPDRLADTIAKTSVKAVMPVHLFGQLAPMAAVGAIAAAAGAVVVEDAAQCQGATQGGVAAGGFGAAAGTSFYPGKNLGAYGDAGAVLTSDDGIAAGVRGLRNYGSEAKYHHPEIGFNSRLDTLQAVVLGAKLPRLDDWNEARRAAAARYDTLLADVDQVVRPATAAGNVHVWHLYVVRVPHRDDVLAALHAAGVGAGIHYPVPVHLQGAFRSLGHEPGSFPVAERAAEEILSLPLFPEITEAQQERVVDALVAALR